MLAQPTNSQTTSTNQQQHSKSPSQVQPRKFDSVKQNVFFKKIAEQRFSGQVILESHTTKPWIFFVHLGRIVYATGGNFATQRWRRNVAKHLPEVNSQSFTLELNRNNKQDPYTCWEYESLLRLVEEQRLSLEQASQIIYDILLEVFFDLNQLTEKSCKCQAKYSFITQLALIEPKQAIFQAWTDWQNWEGENLLELSPNDAPIIQDREKLAKETKPKTYNVLTKLLNSQRSLRDLAVITKRDFVQIAASLKPHIDSGTIKLVTLKKALPPKKQSSQSSQTPSSPATQEVSKGEKPLIACVDDSPLICNKMNEIITNAGYRFLEVNDGVRALASLLRHKPDFIFLDLVMPVINGYEVCAKLRKIAHFKDTPIVILTANDGMFDRLRSKVVGSTDFMSKPIEVDSVLSMLDKYLTVDVKN